MTSGSSPIASAWGFATLIAALAFFGITPAAAEPAPHRFLLEVEAGPVWQSRNDVWIPNNETGTRSPVSELIGTGPYAFLRIYFT